MARCLAIVTVLSILYSSILTEENAVTVDYKEEKIIFTHDSFIGFYKCLCQPAKNPCTAFSMPTHDNFSQVVIVSSSSEKSQSFIPKCVIYPNLNHYFDFVINCTKSDKSTPKLSIRLMNDGSLDAPCPEDSIKVDWPSGVKFASHWHVVQVDLVEQPRSGTDRVTSKYSSSYTSCITVVVGFMFRCVLNRLV